MISEIELFKLAKANGLELTKPKMKRWRKHGIVPVPMRSDTQGKSGSVWLYPEEAKHNVILALTSNEGRNFDGLLMDVWFRGGKVDINKLRKLLLGPLQLVRILVRDIGSTIDKMERQRRPLPFSRMDSETALATANVVFNVMSPKQDDNVWDYTMPGEKSAAQIADETFGIGQLAALIPEMSLETPEMRLDDMKKRLNVQICIDAVKKASEEDFVAIQPYVILMEQWIENISELAVFSPKQFRLFGLFNAIPLPRRVKRIFFCIVMLVFYKDDEGRKTLIDATQEWESVMPRLQVLASYVRYMKKHPKLKKRKRWIEYFNQCDEALADIRVYHKKYYDAHPELQVFYEKS